MDNRLLAIAGKIPDGVGMIDVGTDHGYLPVYLALHGYTGNIIASDINSAPLKTGVENAYDADSADRIQFILSDGLENCPPGDVDTIVIAGMGGDTITGILDRADWVMAPEYLLILQPMTKAEVLRYWLVNNGFQILSEEMTEDAGTVYQIIISRFGGTTTLNDAELFLGKYELVSKSEHFEKRLSKMLYSVEKSIKGMNQSLKTDIVVRRKLLEKIYVQLLAMKERYFGEIK